MSEMLRLMPWSEYDVRDIPTLKSRIAAGADVNQTLPDTSEWPYPLGLAAYYGNVESCRLLLAAGADPECGKQGRTPALVMAIVGRHSTLEKVKQRRFSPEIMTELIKAMVEGGAKPDGENFFTGANGVRCVHSEYSPLFMAIGLNDVTAVKTLIQFGADVELPSGVKALQYASEKGRHKIIAHLIKAGADESCLTNIEDGQTAFQVCVRRGHVDAVEYYVRERGEDLAQRVQGRTMLQWAKDKDMKALLNSLKTEFSIQKALDPKDAPKGAEPVRKSAGMAL